MTPSPRQIACRILSLHLYVKYVEVSGCLCLYVNAGSSAVVMWLSPEISIRLGSLFTVAAMGEEDEEEEEEGLGKVLIVWEVK
ncbi:hypothetical protein E2C01_051510 [Portunus trituberculatus]|uniref:Uncharacterized protein n=1 Tax=Portunus trituberculatus TaxID=210409 RepID=A0A5B7GKI9_PORTR|nr:hypothetical protein [Portunus trituberculatus]